MRKNGDIGLEGGGVLDADISRALRESAPPVRQSIEEWLRQSLAAKEAREARMEEMRLYLASTRDDRERRVREQAEAWERKKAMLEDKVEILGYSLETPGEILAEEAAPGDGSAGKRHGIPSGSSQGMRSFRSCALCIAVRMKICESRAARRKAGKQRSLPCP